MGVTYFKVGDTVQCKYSKAFVGRITKELGEHDRPDRVFGIFWEKIGKDYVIPALREGLYHLSLLEVDLILIKSFTPEYPEDGTWV